MDVQRILNMTTALLGSLLLAAGVVLARPLESRHELAPAETGEIDAVGDVDGTLPLPSKVQGDTMWIADWTFDAGDNCDDTGWVKIDNRICNDGSNYWHIGAGFDGQGGITGQAAILSKHDLCWVLPDGYGNSWDYSIVLQYQGVGSTLSFRFLSDSEPGYDTFTVEADSGGASESRVDYERYPEASSSEFRQELLYFSGP
jgi:hypothetical protein